jgi:hypothetical protein
MCYVEQEMISDEFPEWVMAWGCEPLQHNDGMRL